MEKPHRILCECADIVDGCWSYFGELCTLLELVLHSLVVPLGQMEPDVRRVAGAQAKRRVAVRRRLRAGSLQGSVRGYHSFPFGLVKLLLLQRDATQATNWFAKSERKKMIHTAAIKEKSRDACAVKRSIHCPGEGAIGLKINAVKDTQRGRDYVFYLGYTFLFVFFNPHICCIRADLSAFQQAALLFCTSSSRSQCCA